MYKHLITIGLAWAALGACAKAKSKAAATAPVTTAAPAGDAFASLPKASFFGDGAAGLSVKELAGYQVPADDAVPRSRAIEAEAAPASPTALQPYALRIPVATDADASQLLIVVVSPDGAIQILGSDAFEILDDAGVRQIEVMTAVPRATYTAVTSAQLAGRAELRVPPAPKGLNLTRPDAASAFASWDHGAATAYVASFAGDDGRHTCADGQIYPSDQAGLTTSARAEGLDPGRPVSIAVCSCVSAGGGRLCSSPARAAAAAYAGSITTAATGPAGTTQPETTAGATTEPLTTAAPDESTMTTAGATTTTTTTEPPVEGPAAAELSIETGPGIGQLRLVAFRAAPAAGLALTKVYQGAAGGDAPGCDGAGTLAGSSATNAGTFVVIAAGTAGQTYRLSVCAADGAGHTTRTDMAATPTATCATTTLHAFVTDAHYDGNLGGLAGADAKCQSEAARTTVALLKNRTYGAYLATESADATSRGDWLCRLYDGAGSVIYDPVHPISDNSLNISFAYDQFGGTSFDGYYWSGSNPTGGHDADPQNSCTHWTANDAGQAGAQGDASNNPSGTICCGYQSHATTNPCNTSARLLCIER